jgi:D-alanyl-D-alanine carboxypeptidase
MTTFGTYVRTILDRGRDEAGNDGSPTVEAQHLLLAMAAGPDTTAGQLLSTAGLDHRAIRGALGRGVRVQPGRGRSVSGRI